MISISIIVPIYNVEGYLRACLESIFRQDYPSLEVICVEDCSTDNSRRLLRELALEMPLKLVELPENGGLANARNQGLPHASGDYVLFIDSDDQLKEGLLQHLASRASQNTPDLIVYNHERLWPSGRRRINMLTKLLVDLSKQTIDSNDRAGKQRLFKNLNVAWNKAYRRQFLLDRELSFDDGYYEDITYHYRSIILAEAIAVTPFVGISYLQRQGSILNSSSDKHKDLTLQYRRVYEFLEAQQDDEYLRYIDAEFIHHVFSVLTGPHRGRLTSLARRGLIGDSAAINERFGVAKRISDRQLALKKLVICSPLIMKVAPLMVSLVKRVKGIKPAVRKSKWYLKLRDVKRKYVPKLKIVIYRALLTKLPIKEVAIFESYWGKGYSCSPKAISQYMDDNTEIETVWFGKPAHFDVGPSKYARMGSFRYFYYLAVAKYVVSNANFPNFMIKRKGSVHIQTKHGTPLKYMGFDELRMKRKNQGWFDGLTLRCSRWDYVISSNAYSSEVWRKSFPFAYEMLESGYPRNDYIVNNQNNEKIKEDAREALGIAADDSRKLVLYMPTFRDQKKSGSLPLDIDELAKNYGDEYIFLVRGHYLRSYNVATEDTESVFDVSSYASVEDLYLITDLLISDYSSCIYDFGCLKKPIALFIPDLEDYQQSRGTYYDPRDGAPGLCLFDQEEASQMFASKAFWQPESLANLDSFYNKFCVLNDGQSTERVVRHVLANLP